MRVAVVGSGVSGLAAAWLLNEHSEHEVEIFEANDYIGGHTHTVDFTRKDAPGVSTPVDTGFIVFNPPTYPNLLRFLKLKNVPVNKTEMTFSVSRSSPKTPAEVFEWAGENIMTVFIQRRNVLNPKVWRMVWDILRFNSAAMRVLRDEEAKQKDRAAGKQVEDDEEELSVGDFVTREGLSDSFKDDYLLPMTACIWSTGVDKCSLDFPALTLIRFMHNHFLLQVGDKPKWLTIKGGSKTYVESITSEIPPEKIHLSTPVQSVTKHHDYLDLVTSSGDVHKFDHVVMATHADTTLQILRSGMWGATPEEERVLGAFGFSENECVLHGDEKLLPVAKGAWSAWNYLTSTESSSGTVDSVSLTYNMNILQHIPLNPHGNVLCTLNPPFEPDADKIVGRWKYDHPLYTAESVRAQGELDSIQGRRGMTFCGAWTNYGFHEDGFTSGMKVAQHLSAKPPFPILPASRKIPAVSRIEETTLDNLESIRKLLEHPWTYVEWAMVVVLTWLVLFVELGEKSGVRGLRSVREELLIIRKFWLKEDEEVQIEMKKFK